MECSNSAVVPGENRTLPPPSTGVGSTGGHLEEIAPDGAALMFELKLYYRGNPGTLHDTLGGGR